MNKKYNMIKTTEVMKQKIFSLLLLMFATTLGAWADDAYTLKLRLVIQNYVAETEITNNLTSAYTIDPSILEYLVRNAENGGTKPFYEAHSITIGDGHDPMPSDGSISIVGGITIDDPSHSPNHLRDDASVKLDVTVQMTTDESTKQQFVDANCANLSIKVYHNKHTDNHGTGTDGDGTWQHSDTHHWQGCGNDYGKCVFSSSDTDHSNYPCYHEHVYGTDPSLASYYTCQTPGCGYVDDSRITHEHNYATAWSHDDSQHWHACLNTLGTCNADKTDVGNHSYNNTAVGAAYYTCGVCGYENATRKSEAHTHAYSTSWINDETYHWKQCTNPGPCQEVIKDKAFHTYGTTGDARFKCQVCDFISSSRKAAAEAIDNGKAMAYSWTHDIPFAFAATNIFNDRQLNATGANNKQQGYTVCLPYELTLPATVEVYTLSASKDDQVGFVKTATNTLAPLTPYLIIPSVSGQLLNAPGATVVKTNQTLVDANDVTSSAVSGQKKYTLKGSISYKSGDDAAADAANTYFIMQGENIWAKIEGGDYANTGASESKACILPLRAYLVTAGTAPARLFSFFDETTGIRRDIVLDPDSTPVVYDLQGRRVNAPQRGGLYIINGKKMIMK